MAVTSSALYNSTSALPIAMVDGVVTGDFGTGTVLHTLSSNPWILLDLGAVRQVSGLTLWNRTDCCGDRLDGATILLSAQPFASPDLATARAQPGVSALVVGRAGAVVDLAAVGRWRYVRLQPVPGQVLSLAEIEVMGPLQAAAG